ncbi:MAG: D-sedoheptulose 7-phosphate isomerase [Odoribacteraceae bacterium]|jgi:D-sedoheptulose 7-phosphate isomerase|nr:D-sedoheptulose 7-phosphate isomerase [Odoribacteraceae bacterium]
MKRIIKSSLQEAREALASFMTDEAFIEQVAEAGELLARALRDGHKAISCGNGGSMCDAMHFAEELTGRFRGDRVGLPAIAISDPAHLTCVANDYGFDHVFSRFVESHGLPGDVLLAISTSGNSPNVLKAIDVACERGLRVIGLTGQTGGKMADRCDVTIRVPWGGHSDRVQELHIKIIHILIECVEERLGLTPRALS